MAKLIKNSSKDYRVNSEVRRGNVWPDEAEIRAQEIGRVLREPISDNEAALILKVSSRTILRYRQKNGIANFYERLNP